VQHVFGEHVLDVARRELRRRGELVALEPQVCDLLIYLIENRDRVVSRDDILAAVWGGRIVSESALTTRINAARKAIGDSGAAQDLIRTLPRRGFRFVGAVAEAHQPAAPAAAEASSELAQALPDKPSIAVLPFVNMSGDPEQQYFADGVAEEIITVLSRIGWLSVIARNSSFAYEDQPVDARKIGSDLGARYLLEGSVRDAGGQVRVTAQLIDASNGAHLWADRFDGNRQTVFELQDRVAAGVAAAVASALQSPQINRSGDFPEPPEPVATRRQLTAVSCNLAESAALASRLDPEDLRDLLAAYHRTIADIAARFEGFVAQHSGDGILIYFGYPGAREDDAERAIRCALAVADTVTGPEPDADFASHVGIATSMVVVGDPIDAGGSREGGVIGEAPSLASRLQEPAAPKSVLIGESTRRLVGELFEYRAVAATGIGGRPPVWQVLGPSALASRFEALHGSSPSGLVGRDEEIDFLLRRWARAKAGDGQVVLVSGEPGIGKSRIAAALAERLQAQTHVRLRCFCSPYHRDSALYPFIDQLGRAAGFAPGDSPGSKLEKLAALLSPAAPPDEDAALVADLLSLPSSERHPMPNLSPQRKKERTLEALVRQLGYLAHRQPVLVVFEDVQWIDPTSRELLDLVVERIGTLRVLLIVTFRPELQAPWAGRPQISMLALDRLDRPDRAVLAAQTAGGTELPAEVVAQIADRTDGVPLFVEELTRSVLESGLLREEADRWVLDGPLPPFSIPATLRDSLTARLDRLGSARHVAQIGAAIGREFPYALLRAVSGLSEDELQAALAQCVASELVFQRGRPPAAIYAFKHALVRDAAHDSLLRGVRRQLHARVAEAIEANFPEIMESQPELLAQHYAEAGLAEKSAACWGKAGRRSAARSAMAEAAAQLQKGLEQLALLPDTLESRHQELALRSDLGAVLQAVKGFAAPETGRAYADAQELWEQLGSPTELLEIPFGQSSYLAIRGELALAQRVNEDLLVLSRRRDDSAGLVLGYTCSGLNVMFSGRFASSRSQLEAALAHYDPVSHRSLLHQAGTDPRGIAQSFLGIVLLLLGFPIQALAHSNGAIEEPASWRIRRIWLRACRSVSCRFRSSATTRP
jgi:TolB-like protein